MNGEANTPCVIYAAKSTEDKRGSIPTQLKDGRTLAEREGWEVVGEFNDEGFSAYSGNRGDGLAKAKEAAVAAAAERGGCVLVVQHSDRLARGAGDAPGAADHLGELFFHLRRQGVAIWTVSGGKLDPMRATMEGERNTEDSSRKAQAVSLGKDRQFERGERLGGPVPDGLQLTVERDGADRITLRRCGPDPERAPIIERMFELSEQGHGDAAIARMLNADGHRTQPGKGWTRRLVQHRLLNPIYAGRIDRFRGTEKEEVREATNVEPLIDPERYDRIRAMRAERDRVAARGKGGLRKGDRGRVTDRYALAKLAVCDRCGERMYAVTSPYKRKKQGGTKARRYVCAHSKNSTGLCDQKPIDAEVVDAAVVEHLDRLFIDFDAWIEEVAAARGSQRRGLEKQLGAAEKELDKTRRAAERIQRRYIAREAEAEGSGRGIEKALDAAQQEQDELEKRVRFLTGELARADEPTPTDSLLDAYNQLAEAVRSKDGEGLGELNERLRAKFVEFRMDRMDDGTVGIVPVLRLDPIDVAAAYRAWKEGEERDPTREEISEHDALGHASEPMWVQPKALPILIQEGTDSHE